MSAFTLHGTHDDIDIVLRAPIDRRSDPRVPLNDAAGATASAQVVETSKDGKTALDNLAGAGTLSLTNAAQIRAGDVILIELGDGTVQQTAVDAVVGFLVDITPSLLEDTLAGALVEVLVDPAVVTMDEFGTATLGPDRNWGYRATLPGGDTWRRTGLQFKAVKTLVGAPGGGLTITRTDCIELGAEPCE